MNKIFNYWTISSDANESGNTDISYFIKPKGINKDRPYFKTEVLQQKRGKKGIKNQKKLSIPQAILIIF